MPRNDLYAHPYFQVKTELIGADSRVALSYSRAKVVLQHYRLSLNDIQHCTSRFWDLMTDPILAFDNAMFTIIAAHVGLTIGSLSRHAKKRPDLKPLISRLLRFDTVGIFLLSERGHGLDAFNIETTATKVQSGFVLNTPREEAAKFMPASTCGFSLPKVALVMAKLIVDGEDRGSRLFIVPICNKEEMYVGVRSTRLPNRSGTTPLDFSITTFDNVHLPFTALLADDPFDWTKPANLLEAWWDQVWRIQLGTMTVPGPAIAGTKAAAYIGGKYSLHRTILGKGTQPSPIITFRTQQWPILQGVATAHVMDNWFRPAVTAALAESDHRVRHALSVIIKATICRHAQRSLPEIAERCGAQGTFEHNYMARAENDAKGVIIAEGDVVTLCIRTFSELVQGTYTVPLPPASESLLALHAHGVVKENQELFQTLLQRDHRSPSFNSLIVPQSQLAIEAIGHALAYSAALKARLSPPLLQMYEASVVRLDPTWYAENVGLSRMQQRLKEDAAVNGMLPQLNKYLDELDMEKYCEAIPIVSDHSWKDYYAALPTLSGKAIPEREIYRVPLPPAPGLRLDAHL